MGRVVSAEPMGSSEVNRERDKLLELIRRHGWNATAFQTLEAGYSYFFHGGDACVAYVDIGSAWVAAGAPIAASGDIAAVTAAFVHAARAAGVRCCFSATEERFHTTAGVALRAIRIGEQPVWDPRDWPEIVAGSRSLREQLRRARAKGVAVRLATPEELETPALREAITRIAEGWLATKGMAPMGFLVRLELFGFAADRRCFVAERDGEVIAFAGVIPVPARGGWFIEDLVRDRRAPNGTGELLTDAVMRWAADQGCDWLTLGLAPLAGDVPGLLKIARTSTSLLYDFSGLRSYKAKLHPNSWSPIYLAYPPTQSTLLSLRDMLAAFARGGLVRFAMRSLLRGPTAVLRVLATLLVPWTLILVAAPAYKWFGAPWVKWGWVIFDVLVAAGLFRLLRRPKRALATVLAAAVSADAVLTLTQAVVWNAPRARSPAEYVVMVIACAAPMMAAVMLWGARNGRIRE